MNASSAAGSAVSKIHDEGSRFGIHRYLADGDGIEAEQMHRSLFIRCSLFLFLHNAVCDKIAAKCKDQQNNEDQHQAFQFAGTHEYLLFSQTPAPRMATTNGTATKRTAVLMASVSEFRSM